MKLFSKTGCVAAALLLYGVAVWIYAPLVAGDPYHYDEADYMWAGKQGLAANYTDRNGLSFVEFVRKGLELSRNPGERQSFSEFIRTTGDIGMYRHYHGPVYAYWLGLVQKTGTVAENVFRGSGLLIHGATALLILLGFWVVFPGLPPPAALAACALFIFNKTALMAATSITQHGIFTFFCTLALFAAARFMRGLEARWFYATMAAVGVSLCAVETSVLILPAVALSLLADFRRVREQWPTLRSFLSLVFKGLGAFLLAILVTWPKGVLQLGMLKGFLTLGYIAVYRKTFSPIGPVELAAIMYRSSPWEFSMLIAGAIAAFAVWKNFPQRRELLPWLGFIAVFFGVLLKVTAPYTYYFAPLTAALTVACGVACGVLWNRAGLFSRILVPVAVVASIVGTTAQYRAVLSKPAPNPYQVAVVKRLRTNPGEAAGRYYLPYQLLPTLHYYFPDMKMVGYDFDFPTARLVDGLQAEGTAPVMLCEERVCAQIDQRIPGFAANKHLLDPKGPNGEPLYVVSTVTPGSF